MTIRNKILLYAVLAIIVLVAARVVGLFLPPAIAVWVWRIILIPYVLVGGIAALVLLLTIVLCLGKIRYRVNANIGNDTTANVEVSYLLRLVHFAFVYRDGVSENKVRIAWMKLGEEKPRKKKRRPKSTDSKKDTQAENGLAAYVARQVDEALGNGKTAEPTNRDDTPVEKDKPPPGDGANPAPEKEKKDRLKPLKQVKAALTYPDRKIIMSLCFKCLQKFFKALKPKKLDIYGVIGFDDPCTTGWVMGVYEAAAGVMQLRHKVRLVGSYHEKALDLAIKTEGRTRLWSLIWPFIWLYLHKPIRVVLHKHIFKNA